MIVSRYIYEFTVMFVFSEAQLNLQKFWFKDSSSVYNVEGIAFLNWVLYLHILLFKNILCLIVNNSINRLIKICLELFCQLFYRISSVYLYCRSGSSLWKGVLLSLEVIVPKLKISIVFFEKPINRCSYC